MKDHRGRAFDLVYNNTATNGRVVTSIQDLGVPILTHVHELAQNLRRLISSDDLRHTLSSTDHFLAVSNAVAADLRMLGVPADKIAVVPNSVAALPCLPSLDQQVRFRHELGLPVDANVIVGCGHIHPIKGTDLFVELAAAVTRIARRKVVFAWIGGETDRALARRVRRESRLLHLENIVRFVGPLSDPAPWFATSDVVAVTSRLESFSLVALEAASWGRPVVGFSGARGLAEVLGETPRLLIADFNIQAMASALDALLRNPAEARELGMRLRLKVENEFLRPPQIDAILVVAETLRREQLRKKEMRR